MLGTKLEETRVYREAQKEKAQEIALNLFENISLETIARTTGLIIEQLQKLQAETIYLYSLLETDIVTDS